MEIHDNESYIITIQRKGTVTLPEVQAFTGLKDTKVEEPCVGQVSSAQEKVIKAPLPGIIIDIYVKVGDRVKAGQEVAMLEAMKMENTIEATAEGTVTAVKVSARDSVLEGETILIIE